jgi:hypothetical protein
MRRITAKNVQWGSRAPLEGWRHVKVTDRHTAVDYALGIESQNPYPFKLIEAGD